MPENNKEKNEKFYELILELVKTNSEIIERLDRVEKLIKSKDKEVTDEDWSKV